MGKKVKRNAVNAENIFVMVALIVLNVLFVIHVLISWIGALIGLVAGSIATVIAGVVCLVVSVFSSLAPATFVGHMMLSVVSPAALIFLSIALICLGGLWMIGNYYLVKYSYKLVAWYVKLNVRVFKKYEP